MHMGAVGITLFAVVLLLELSIFVSPFCWRHKKAIAAVSLLITDLSVALMVMAAFSAATVLMALFTLYRAINTLRLVEVRMHDAYLRRAALRSMLWLAAAQIAALAVWATFATLPSFLTGTKALTAISMSFAAAGMFVLISTLKNLRATRVSMAAPMADIDMPTLTVAIAARNENSALQHCLESVIACDYPKLEVIVLDDCSQDHTAEVIKSFAHDGVRFVQGEQPNDTWLAKNQAYQTLLEQATGQLILFMGVDVHLNKTTLRRVVEQFRARNVTMLSVLPKRTQSGTLAAFIQPMRYWWELALPEWIIKHTPVLSTCWIADRHALIKEGGFKSVMRAIIPEEHLSTAFNKRHAYAFVRTNNEIGLATHKDFKSQWLTAVRTRYPQAHRRPEYVVLRVLIMLYFLIAPFIVLPLLLSTHAQLATIIMTAISIVALVVSHVLIVAVTNPIALFLALINFPIVVVIDFIALHISMYRYEFSEVIWRGRDVTTPAMHVIPHLPILDDRT